MIRIDNISFDFKMDNEVFAYGLYAKWDEFCRECVENVIEEYLKEYDRKKILLTVDELELDLGTLQEDEFYRQFPVRLREALQRRLSLSGIRKDREELSCEARLDNLIFFLKNGFCHTEWADADFNISEELQFLAEYLPQRIPGLIHSCFNSGYMLERLMEQGDDTTFIRFMTSWHADERISHTEKQQAVARLSVTRHELIAGMLVRLYGQYSLFLRMISLLESGLQSDPSLSSAMRSQIRHRIMKYLPERLRSHLLKEWKESMLWLSSPSVSLYEKRRYLGLLLDTRPQIPVRFIHETAKDSHLDRLAEILDSIAVKQIMATESEPHAEVDVPAYWHYLYDWLIEHYPFNGIAIFGDKRQFRLHLNRRLLTFIRKRDYAVYLSKEELTLKFLLEVFGQEYYLDLLNQIFNQQPRNVDGSPVYTGAFNPELYRIFLKLSLLRQPVAVDEKSDGKSLDANETGKERIKDAVQEISVQLSLDSNSTNPGSESDMQQTGDATALLSGRLEHLRARLEDTSVSSLKKRRMVARFLEMFWSECDRIVLSMQTAGLLDICVAVMDTTLFELLVMQLARKASKGQNMYLVSVCQWILMQKELFSTFLSEEKNGWKGKLLIMLADWSLRGEITRENADEMIRLLFGGSSGKEHAAELFRLIGHSDRQEFRNRQQLAQEMMDVFRAVFDTHTNTPGFFLNWLREDTTLREAKREMLQLYINRSPHDFFSQLRASSPDAGTVRMLAEMVDTYSLLQGLARQNLAYAELWSQLYGLLNKEPGIFPYIGNAGRSVPVIFAEALIRFLLEETGTGGDLRFPVEELIRRFVLYVYRVCTGRDSFPSAEIQVWERASLRIEDMMGLHTQSISFDMNLPERRWIWDDIYLSEWLNNSQVSVHRKQHFLRLYIGEQPQRLLEFIRSTAVRQILPGSQWKEWLDERDWIRLLAGISVSQAEMIQQVIDYLLEKEMIGMDAIRDGLMTYVVGKEREKRKPGEGEMVRQFISDIDFSSGETEKNVSEMSDLKIELLRKLKRELNMENADQIYFNELREDPKDLLLSNAGLVLLSPWFPRLFLLLGYLTDDRKDFKDMETRIRAIFVLQRCLGTDKDQFQEQELSLNRLLVGCPFSVPLPRTLELSNEEKDIVVNMMNGAKANWTKMNNTSMKGFQDSFINRSGHMNQEEKRWVLTVDERGYDILLDSLPWTFRYIQYSWLKKRIYVEWRSNNYPDYQ